MKAAPPAGAPVRFERSGVPQPVAIRSSASQEVRRLLGALEQDDADDARREAALARLAVIGTRAVRQLLEHLAADPPERARIALLAALERIPDPRAIEPVLERIGSPSPDERLAAMRAARTLVTLPEATALLDRLTGFVLDGHQPSGERVAALQALSSLPSRTLRPVIERLRDDADASVRAAAHGSAPAGENAGGDLEEAADGWLPRDPEHLLQMLARGSGDVPLSTLHRLVEIVRGREADGPAARRRDWSAVRGALHLALARRGSTVALYDLREAVAGAREPLALDYLTAMTLVGDGSCLEPLAAAYVQAASMADAEGWRREVAAAFRAIVGRERITRRHGAIRRIRARLGTALDEML